MHATITSHTAAVCVVTFDYDADTKNAVKELAGATVIVLKMSLSTGK